MPHLVEDSIRECLAEKLGLKETVFQATDFDIDGCLLKFKKPEILLEVKWKNNMSAQDIKKAEDSLGKINGKRRVAK